ncbi:MAG: ABC transporter substrate-binding protein [Nitrospira sp.]|nr:ABC transporter substrate-binding protein [Nitrospira sp.]MDH4344599.1 ABC transporter substrate-binding protein [Nitrospira sp.]
MSTASRRILRYGLVREALLALCLCAAVEAAEPSSPTAAVKLTVGAVIGILTDEALAGTDQQERRRQMLETTVGRRFDYREISRRAVGRQWKRISESERREFVALFQVFLAGRYADRIEGYANEEVQYLGERRENGYAEVQTKLVSDKVDLPIDYRLFFKSGDWFVYDVVINGVSLVKNYRSQFRAIMHKSSYTELVRRLREKTIAEP